MLKKNGMPAVSLAAMALACPAAIIGTPRAESNPGKIEALLGEVKSELSRIGDEVKRTAEEALRQSKDAGKLSDEVRAKADELIHNQTRLTEAQQKLTEKLEALETRNHDLEQKLAAARLGAGRERPKSLGQQVAESDALKAFAANGARGSVLINVKQAITSLDGSAGDLIWSDRETGIVGMPQRQMTIRNLLSQARTTSNLVEYAKQVTRTNNARVVTEGAEKPESVYVWDRADAPVRTIAHIAHVSRQAMDDAAQLQSELDNELRYGLRLAEELQILKGDGSGQNISGLVTEATQYSAAFTPTNGTLIDTLRLAILQVALADYAADGIVLHPTDWARIELQKESTTGAYLWANPRASNGPGLWGLPVLPTQSMDIDEFLVGAFRMAATIYDRMDVEVLISSEHSDNFVKNMLTARAEERLALAVKRPASLVTGDFGFVT